MKIYTEEKCRFPYSYSLKSNKLMWTKLYHYSDTIRYENKVYEIRNIAHLGLVMYNRRYENNNPIDNGISGSSIVFNYKYLNSFLDALPTIGRARKVLIEKHKK